MAVRKIVESKTPCSTKLRESKNSLKIEIPKVLLYSDKRDLEDNDGNPLTDDQLVSAGFKVKGDNVYLPSGTYDAEWFRGKGAPFGFSFKMKDGEWYDFLAEPREEGRAFKVVGKKYESLKESIVDEYDGEVIDLAQMSFESGHYFERSDFDSNAEYEEYLGYMDMGPEGFYEEFKDQLDFDPDFVAMYGYDEYDEALNLDSYGKSLKRAIKNLTLDSDEELRDFVNKVVDEVIAEENSSREPVLESNTEFQIPPADSEIILPVSKESEIKPLLLSKGFQRIVKVNKGRGFNNEYYGYSDRSPSNSDIIVHVYKSKNDDEGWILHHEAKSKS